jgi:glyoxylase-like metal-dependent hydrolase (beta-lactamase superfamily II)
VIRLEREGEMVRLDCSSWRSRRVGFAVSAFVVRGVLVDTGFPGVGAELERVLDVLRPIGAIVTHAHEDHAGNVERLARRGLPMWMPPQTMEAARHPAPIGFYRRWTWGSPTPLRSPVVPFEPEGVRVIHAPGHSPDHHVVWDEESGTLVSGDLFIGVKVRVAHTYERPREHARTLRTLAALDPARMLDAHRGILTHPSALLRAKADWIEEMIASVERLAAAGHAEPAIRDAVLGKEDWTGWFSAGDYSRLNMVRCVLAERG